MKNVQKTILAAVLTATTATSAFATDTAKTETASDAKAAPKAAPKAQASKSFDLSTLTCGEFLQMSAPEAVTTLSWIDGYLTQKDGAPVWDVETFVQHRDKLINICVDKDGKDKVVLEEIQNLN